MALGPMAWMAMTLAVVILSLTFGPGWSLVFLILVGVIFGEVPKGKQEEPKKQNLPDSALARDAPARDAPDHLINVPADASDHAPADAPVEVHEGKQEEQEKQNLPDSAPSRDAPAHAPDHLIDVPADASDHAPADAPADAPAHVVDVPADGLALSVDAPTPVADAPASLADAPALSGDSLAPAVDAPADAALLVDALADAPAISVDAQVDAPALSVDAPVDASALAPAVVAAGIRMRRKRKFVLKLDLHDDRDRSKAMQVVLDCGEVVSVSVDLKDQKLTVIGDVDVSKLVDKLRKSWHAEVVSVE